MIDLSTLSLAKTIEYLSTGLAIAVFAYHWRKSTKAGKDANLKSLMSRALKAGSLPTAAVLVMCGFDASLVGHLKGVGVYLSVAGLATSYVCIKAVTEADAGA